MKLRYFLRTIATAACIALCPLVFGQQTQAPLTNADLIKMVKGGLPESVVIAAIQSRPGKFDTSPDGLIALHKAGLTQSEMDAVMAASSAPQASPAAPGPPTGNAAIPAAPGPSTNSRMPKVAIVGSGGSVKELPLERTHLAETRTKPSSMKSLAADSAVGDAMRAGINTATFSAATHVNPGVEGASVAQAGSIFSNIMSRHKASVTYVWGVLNPASANVLETASPAFSVDFSRAPRVNPEEFEPAIVKLTPAQNTSRLVGATQGKEDVGSGPAADWQLYSSFLEERVAVKSQMTKPGLYKILPASSLVPGEYAVVLRPIARSKKFSGGDVARGQGDGLLFDSVWSFEVAPDAAE